MGHQRESVIVVAASWLPPLSGRGILFMIASSSKSCSRGRGRPPPAEGHTSVGVLISGVGDARPTEAGREIAAG